MLLAAIDFVAASSPSAHTGIPSRVVITIRTHAVFMGRASRRIPAS